jgi:hypothetical protein
MKRHASREDLLALSSEIPLEYGITGRLKIIPLDRVPGWTGFPEKRGYGWFLVFKTYKHLKLAIRLSVAKRLQEYLGGGAFKPNGKQRTMLLKYSKVRAPRKIIAYLDKKYDLKKPPHGFEVLSATGRISTYKEIVKQANRLKEKYWVQSLRDLKGKPDFEKHRAWVASEIRAARVEYNREVRADILEALMEGYSPRMLEVTEEILRYEVSHFYRQGWMSIEIKKALEVLSKDAHMYLGTPKRVRGYFVYHYRPSTLRGDDLLKNLPLVVANEMR